MFGSWEGTCISRDGIGVFGGFGLHIVFMYNDIRAVLLCSHWLKLEIKRRWLVDRIDGYSSTMR